MKEPKLCRDVGTDLTSKLLCDAYSHIPIKFAVGSFTQNYAKNNEPILKYLFTVNKKPFVSSDCLLTENKVQERQTKLLKVALFNR